MKTWGANPLMEIGPRDKFGLAVIEFGEDKFFLHPHTLFLHPHIIFLFHSCPS